MSSSKDLEELKDIFESWQCQLSILTNVAFEQANHFDKNIMKPLKTFVNLRDYFNFQIFAFYLDICSLFPLL